MYASGRGVSQDYAAAVSWYRKAAEQGEAKAQSGLGLMYANGHGVPKDYVSAHVWFTLAAAGGDKASERNRKRVAAKMTPGQIAQVQALANDGGRNKHQRFSGGRIRGRRDRKFVSFRQA
jgi:TPR repeat protein